MFIGLKDELYAPKICSFPQFNRWSSMVCTKYHLKEAVLGLKQNRLAEGVWKSFIM